MTKKPTASQIKKLRSRKWFDNPDNPDMTAIYLERYMNYGLTREELSSGKPIIGIAQSGSDLSPCNRHHLVLAQRVREGIREAGGVAFEFPVHPIQETGKRPTASLDRNLAYLGPGGDPLRLSDRRRRAHHRLRQDHALTADGGRHRRHPGYRAVRRTDAERLVPRRAHGLGHHRVEGAADARRRRDRLRAVRRAGRLLGALARALQHHGHGLDHELVGRGAGHVAAGLRRTARPAQGARPARLPDRQAHRRHGVGGSASLQDHDARGVRERHRRQLGDRRLDQRADPFQCHRQARRRRTRQRRLGEGRLCRAAAGQPAAVRPVPGRGIPPRRRRAGRRQRADEGPQDPRACTDRERPLDRRELRRPPRHRSRRDPPLQEAAEGQGRLPQHEGQPVRQRHHEDERHLRGIPQALPGEPEGPQRLRGPRHRVRRARGLSQAHRRPGAEDRRDLHPVHARRRPDRLSRRRRGRQHAATELSDQERGLRAVLHRRWPPVRHLGLALDPERLAGSGHRRRARHPEDGRQGAHRPQQALGRYPHLEGGDRQAAGRPAGPWRLQISGPPDALAGDPTRHGRRAFQRHGAEAGSEVPAHRREEGRAAR